MTPLDPGGFWSYSAPRPMALGENGPIGMTKSARLDFVRPAGIMHKSDGETSTQDETVRDVLLVALTVASGAVDAISYFGLGKIFSAFMTGNIVYLGFGIAQIEGPGAIPVISALSMFAAGSYLGLRITTLRSKESGPWPPAMTVLLTLVAIAESASLAVWLATTGHPPTAGLRCAHRPVLARYGDTDRGGSITRCARRVHYGWDIHAGRIDRYFRRISVEGRDPSPRRRIRRVGRGRRWRRTALATRAQLCTAAAAGDHCSGDRGGAAHGASHVGRR